MSEILHANLGDYVGSGVWRDAAGATKEYSVAFSLERVGRDLRIAFVHEFFEEPNVDDIALNLVMEYIAPSILAFEQGSIQGRGFQTANVLHYDFPVHGNLVSAT